MRYETRREKKSTGTATVPCERPASSLGLSTARQKTNLTLEQIADSTKISLRFLRAIEAEQFERLPGGIFSTSYLRQYAKCIGYDEVHLLARFNEVTNPEPEVIPEQAVSPKPTSTGLRQLFRWLGIPLPAQLIR